ncbi:U6 snRNA-associated Sm-like protein LSm4 [Plodia interpunctella]|uniref:U6 snRNA-associated Sm-like protein LSm4 n=1 Tax=Plodia interpunctella TaxID=58824 RepID=UPI00236801EF|nr:U6 snRNA-associated Sm-like protein LSm4 [Plodia interpunctella]
MLPLSLLRTAQNHPMLVELKNGETYNGHLVSCDNWMNINLREVICTSRDGDKFWRMPECYIRGSTIKYLRIPDEVIDMVKEETQVKARGRSEVSKGRGGGQNMRSSRGGARGAFGNRGRPAPLARGGGNTGRPQNKNNNKK